MFLVMLFSVIALAVKGTKLNDCLFAVFSYNNPTGESSVSANQGQWWLDRRLEVRLTFEVSGYFGSDAL